jgi:hypothetical protein
MEQKLKAINEQNEIIEVTIDTDNIAKSCPVWLPNFKDTPMTASYRNNVTMIDGTTYTLIEPVKNK